jgi:hypothetical protein
MKTTNLEGHLIATSFYEFEIWEGKPIENNYGGKTVLFYNNQPFFSELVALQIFIEQGFNGVWVDTFKKKYRIGLPENTEPVFLPTEIQNKLEVLLKINGSSKGVWDLLLWKNDQLKFVELKRITKDKIRTTQINFLKSCLSCGLKTDQFEILEWKEKKNAL